MLWWVETLHLYHGSVFEISFCNFMFMAFSECVLALPKLKTINHEELNLQKCQQH